jgi:hypothetical protein
MKDFDPSQHYTAEELAAMPRGACIDRDVDSDYPNKNLTKVRAEEEFGTFWDWQSAVSSTPGFSSESPETILAIRGSETVPGDFLVTVEEYAGTEETGIDVGALNIFRLANSMRGRDAYEPMSVKLIEAAEVFAAELAFRVHAAGEL